MNMQAPRTTPALLAERVDIELRKCDDIRARYEGATDETERAGLAQLLGRLVFWACIAIEDMASAGSAPAGIADIREVVALRNSVAGRAVASDRALQAHDRLRGFFAREQ